MKLQLNLETALAILPVLINFKKIISKYLENIENRKEIDKNIDLPDPRDL